MFTRPTLDAGLFMDTILGMSVCHKHGASLGEACWIWDTASGKVFRAVCNSRAKHAGFNNHVVSANAMSRTTPNQTREPRARRSQAQMS